jgi:aminopeptidase N
MTEKGPQIIHRSDYREPEFLIPTIDLTFDLRDTGTIVASSMKIERNGAHREPLRLNAEKIRIFSVEMDGSLLTRKSYEVTDTHLIINDVPDSFLLRVLTEINPLENRALEGLYKSGDIFCTQNEPEGFRRITCFMDRPDVMSVFTTRIIAHKEKYPVLLSNGNCVETEDYAGGRHMALWHDPFPKPAYLFALVAGDLGMVRDTHVTKSGRSVDCRVYCDRGNEDRCRHALASLKKAMKWDEERFGLEYDLDIYMIVAVDSFNMGAMENKGLNIFNSKYVLASEDTATDDDYMNIEAVVAHEYFHNWTGNRVTLRDWFQLTLKEGLTVFRDQEFTSDMHSRAVKRIDDANDLRAIQFIEDSGPNAHPVRPDTYMEINNFYTVTVYEKGAEVIRMIQTLLGREGFRKGMDRYFELHDGQAVTCEDFIGAMESANAADLSHFRLWYSQAGTPELDISSEYDAAEKIYRLHVSQSLPATPGQTGKKPLHIPLAVGLLDSAGHDMTNNDEGDRTVLLHLHDERQDFVFTNITEEPCPSLNRNFSAPVKVRYPYSGRQLAFLFAHDSDDFNRWDSGQAVARSMHGMYMEELGAGFSGRSDRSLLDSYGSVIMDRNMDFNIKALALTLPSEEVLALEYNPVDFDALHDARERLQRDLALRFENELLELYYSLGEKGAYSFDTASAGRRRLRLCLLAHLVATGRDEHAAICQELYASAGNMTEKMGALRMLAGIESPRRDAALRDFYDRWKGDQRVITKWLSVQAFSPLRGRLDEVIRLEKDEVFDIRIPNLVRALIGAFSQNLVNFNDITGRGYAYVADKIIEIDAFNPSISSLLARSFKLYPRTDSIRRGLIEKELE